MLDSVVTENMMTARELALQGWSSVIEREIAAKQLTMYEDYVSMSCGSVSAYENENEASCQRDMFNQGSPWVSLTGCVEE